MRFGRAHILIQRMRFRRARGVVKAPPPFASEVDDVREVRRGDRRGFQVETPVAARTAEAFFFERPDPHQFPVFHTAVEHFLLAVFAGWRRGRDRRAEQHRPRVRVNRPRAVGFKIARGRSERMGHPAPGGMFELIRCPLVLATVSHTRLRPREALNAPRDHTLPIFGDLGDPRPERRVADDRPVLFRWGHHHIRATVGQPQRVAFRARLFIRARPGRATRRGQVHERLIRAAGRPRAVGRGQTPVVGRVGPKPFQMPRDRDTARARPHACGFTRNAVPVADTRAVFKHAARGFPFGGDLAMQLGRRGGFFTRPNAFDARHSRKRRTSLQQTDTHHEQHARYTPTPPQPEHQPHPPSHIALPVVYQPEPQ